MADKNLSIKAITGETETIRPTEVNRTSTFLKLAGAAIGSYYLAKEEPEAFQSFTTEIKRQQDVSDTDAADQAKAAAGTIGALITKNALDREKRVDENFASIEILVGLGLDSASATKASQDGYGAQLVALKKEYPNLIMKDVYNAIDRTKIKGMSNKDFANVLSGKMARPKIEYGNFRTTPSGIEKLFGFDGSKNLQEKIKRSVDSQDTSGTDLDSDMYKFGKEALSKLEINKGIKDLLANAGTKGVTPTKNIQLIAQNMESFFNLKVGVVGESYTFEEDVNNNQVVATDAINAMHIKIEDELKRNKLSTKPDARITRTSLRNKYMRKYFGRVKKTTKVNGQDVVSYDYEPLKDVNKNYIINELDTEQKIIPNDWTSTGVTGSGKVNNKLSNTLATRKAAELARHKRAMQMIKSKVVKYPFTDAMKQKQLDAAIAEHNKKMAAIK
tara:strand:- start:2638 stop:3972 length:1335 start_codon:yes stop_codon:yes gene_type:complete